MSWHLADYTVALGTTVNTDVPALVDDVLTINNNHFILRSPMSLVMAMAMSATLSRARFDSPTLRFYGNPFIRPITVGAAPGNNPNIEHLYEHPITLPAGEEIAIQATSGIAMGTERFHGLVALQDVMEAIPGGNPYPVRFTSTTAAVANTWTTLSYTMDQALPSGQFDMVMSEVQSTNQIAHRWLFDAQQWRPGFSSLTSLANRGAWDFYLYRYGKMGSFWNTSMPRLQVLATAADATHEGYMWVIPRAGTIGRNVVAGM